MIKIAKRLLQSETARDTSYLFGGTVVSNIFGFVVIAILTRSLNPAGFGLFITAFTFTQMLADFSELGVNTGSLNYIAKSEGQERKLFLKNSLLLKILATGTAAILVLFFAKQLTELFFKNKQMEPFVQVSAIGALLLAFIAWSQSIFQSENKFFLSAIMNSSTNVVRFLAIGLLLIFGWLTPISSYAAFQLVLLLTAIIFFITHDLSFLKVAISKQRIKEIIKFGLPIGLSFSLSSIYTRLDQILVFNFLGSKEAGIYGLAMRMMLVIIFVVAAFGSAIAPRYAHMSKTDFGAYFKKSLYVSGGLMVMALLAAVTASILIPLIFGQSYQASVPVFQILALGIIPFIASIPLNLFLIFRRQKNMFIFILGVFSLILSWVLLNILVPNYGIIGAASAVATINLFQFLAYLIYTLLIRNRTFIDPISR